MEQSRLCFALNAVVFERVGSVSSAAFALPVVRAIPRRYPRVATYFDLDRDLARAEDRDHDRDDEQPATHPNPTE